MAEGEIIDHATKVASIKCLGLSKGSHSFTILGAGKVATACSGCDDFSFGCYFESLRYGFFCFTAGNGFGHIDMSY